MNVPAEARTRRKLEQSAEEGQRMKWEEKGTGKEEQTKKLTKKQMTFCEEAPDDHTCCPPESKLSYV
ncbi:hypothetical protein ILYODFUR_004179 [Ilyodon furcidens]|uniref:Uncharacterized protein n=1 Tax=Ilyodon furcidens TaxID=33524 RepID=A0ABV0VAX7_9TELE